MLRFKINDAKSFFFDRAIVSAVDKASGRVLSKFGAHVRTTAKNLIRSPGKKGKPSKPGQPPKNRTGLLKDFIYFVWDPARRSVVIGPARLNGANTGKAPEVLEYGGQAIVNTRKLRRGRSPEREKKSVRIEARPFMGPAYAKEAPELPAMWRDSVK
jgi:hypothetical protein